MSLVECAVLGVLSSFAIILNEEERWVLYFNCLPGVSVAHSSRWRGLVCSE